MMAETLPTIVEPEIELLRQEPKRRGHTAGVIGLVLLLVLIAASITGAHRWGDSLTIKRVVVEGNRIVPAADIVQGSKVKEGTPLYGIDLKTVRDDILSQLYIKAVDVVREFPDALRIVVQERQPIAALSRDRILFLDDEGVLLPPYGPNVMVDVPFITGIMEMSRAALGRVMELEAIQRAVSFARRARDIDQEVYHLISEIRVEENGDIVLFSSDAGVRILLGKLADEKKLHLLKTFWDQFVQQRGAQQLLLVDLRYDGQVIARWGDEDAPRIMAMDH